MITQMLVPIDFSPVSDNAISYALKLAEKCNAHVHLLHVKQIPVMDASFPADTYQLFVTELEELERQNVERITTTFLKGAPVKYTFHSTVGFVGDEIVDFSEKNAIDLVVMGTTGASGIQELLIGSNAATVIGKSKIPVLVIPPGHPYKELGHIMYATDYNEPEFPAVSRLFYFAELYQAKVTILHVKTEYDKYFNSEHNFFTRNKSDISYDFTIINADHMDVTEAIDMYVNDKNADLLVMAKHNRSFFDRLFHRSLSKKIAYHTKVPLLVLNK